MSVAASVGFFFFSSRRRHTRLQGDWSSDVCSSDLGTSCWGGEGVVKKHLKRLPAPRAWRIERKTAFWTMRPSPGAHPIEGSVPVGLVLRDMLGICDTAREARAILGSRTVLIDGRPVTNPKFAVGVMDVLGLQATKEHYRMLVDTMGRLRLVPIDAEQAQWKLCRIEDKTTQRGGKIQGNLHR